MSGDAAYSSHLRPEMVSFVPDRRGRVLEVGCAEGRFLAALPGVTERWGIEPSPAAVVARERLDRVFQCPFEAAEAELPAGYFDVVICNDVIEHMPDADYFFGRIGRYMAPGAVLVGSIPNVRFYQNLFEFLIEKDWEYRDWGILDRTHFRFFTEKSLRKTIGRGGLEIRRLEGLLNAGVPREGRGRWYYLLSRLLIAATFGYFSDIQYLQFGFQAVVRDGGASAMPESGAAVMSAPAAVAGGGGAEGGDLVTV